MENELWIDIPGYNGLYLVSQFGRILSKATNKKTNGRIMVDACNGKGYRYITISVNAKRKNYYVHRLVAQAFLNNPNGHKEVNHKDGDKANNHYSNLEWISKCGNMQHAHANGLMHPTRGEQRKNAKLTDAKVRDLKDKFYNQNMTCVDLAEQYGICHQHVYAIMSGRKWGHIEHIENPIFSRNKESRTKDSLGRFAPHVSRLDPGLLSSTYPESLED